MLQYGLKSWAAKEATKYNRAMLQCKLQFSLKTKELLRGVKEKDYFSSFNHGMFGILKKKMLKNLIGLTGQVGWGACSHVNKRL